MGAVTQTVLALAETYYRHVVGPLISDQMPGLRYAAGRLGSGSDVLGLDDRASHDHDWGLRLTLLVDDEHVAAVDDMLERSLPRSFRGYPTRFATTWHPSPRHQVEVATPDGFARSRLGIDPREPLTTIGWLSLTGQSILEITAGAVFHDDVGRITAIRAALTWYPHDLWLYVIAADWARISQELPFIGRAGSRGDELGSRVISARVARTAMHLGFMLERRWAPYGKWLGTEFARLPKAGAALAPLTNMLSADDWRTREHALSVALELLNDLQRSIGLPAGDTATEPFYDRAFLGLASIPELLIDVVADPDVARLPQGVGALEQWSDNVDVLTSAERRTAFTRALEAQTTRSRQDR